MGFAVRWLEDSPFGPDLDLLAYVEDMGQARRLADEARLDRKPTKAGRLTAQDPLTEVARAHPGELLWRIAFEGESTWRVGAAEAARLRAEDVARFDATREQALGRRRSRRRNPAR
jgi:hypothetical protein